MKTIVFTIAMMFGMNAAMAENDFSTLQGIPAVSMSNEDLDSVEGKGYEYSYQIGLYHVNDFTGDIYHVRTGTYLGRRQVSNPFSLAAQKKAFPDPRRNSTSSPSQTASFNRQSIFSGQKSYYGQSGRSLPFNLSYSPNRR